MGINPKSFHARPSLTSSPPRCARPLQKCASTVLAENGRHFFSIGTRWRNKSLRLNSSIEDQISAGISCGGADLRTSLALNGDVDVDVDLRGLQPTSLDGWQAGRTLPAQAWLRRNLGLGLRCGVHGLTLETAQPTSQIFWTTTHRLNHPSRTAAAGAMSPP